MGPSGGGDILKDSVGKIFFAFSSFFEKATSIQAEVKALLCEVQIYLQYSISRFYVECDSQLLILVLQRRISSLWSISGEIQELMNYLAFFVSPNHAYGEANKVADELPNVGCLDQFDSIFHSKQSLSCFG